MEASQASLRQLEAAMMKLHAKSLLPARQAGCNTTCFSEVNRDLIVRSDRRRRVGILRLATGATAAKAQ